MSAFQNILFSTDFSDPSQHAEQYALALAKQSGGALHVLHVVDTAYVSYAAMYGQGVVVAPETETLEKDLEEHVNKIVAHAKTYGIDAHGHVVLGKPATEIVEHAEKNGCDLIVMGSHGRSGFERLIFGSTYKGVIRTATMPVLGIKSDEREFTGEDLTINIERIMCPLDLSEVAQTALPTAVELCKQFDATLMLLHVVDTRLELVGYPTVSPFNTPDMRKRAAELLEEMSGKITDVRVDTHTVEGLPHREIAKAVDDYDVHVLVMATHGLSGVSRALLGSTTEKSVRLAKCPVITVRPAEEED